MWSMALIGKKVKQTFCGQDHFLVQALMAKGFSNRRARAIVNEVISIWLKELAKGNSIETPVGYLLVTKETRTKQRRWNKIRNEPEYVYKRKNKVIFKPNDK
jgi:hypothetical protein